MDWRERTLASKVQRQASLRRATTKKFVASFHLHHPPFTENIRVKNKHAITWNTSLIQLAYLSFRCQGTFESITATTQEEEQQQLAHQGNHRMTNSVTGSIIASSAQAVAKVYLIGAAGYLSVICTSS